MAFTPKNSPILLVVKRFYQHGKPVERPVTEVDNRGLYFGDGFFTTIQARIFDSGMLAVLAWRLHQKRINEAFAALSFVGRFEENNLRDALRHFAHHEPIQPDMRLKIRIQFWRKDKLHFSTESATSAWDHVLTVEPAPATLTTDLRSVGIRKTPNNCLPVHVKSSSALSFVLAQREAQGLGGSQALMLNHDGFVSEASYSNLAWLLREQWFAPDSTCDAYPGITLTLLEEWLAEQGKTLHRGQYELDSLKKSDQLFTLNSLSLLRAVSSLDEKKFKPHLDISSLESTFRDFAHRHPSTLQLNV